MTLDEISHSDVKNLIGSSAYNKGRGYRSRVKEPFREGEVLEAQVSETKMYTTRVDFRGGEFRSSCSCPYDWEPYCKHIGALLIRWVEDPHSFRVQKADMLPTNRLRVEAASHPKSAAPKEPPTWLADDYFFGRLSALRAQLQRLYEAMRLQDLRDIAKARGWKVKGTAKQQVSQQIVEKVEDAAEIHTSLNQLDSEHRNVLRAMSVLGYNMWVSTSQIETVAKVWGDLKTHKLIGTYIGHLIDAGLVMDGDLTYTTPVDFIFPLVERHLPPMLVDVMSPAAEPDDTYQITLSSPMTFPRAANQLIALLGVEKIELRPLQSRPTIEKIYPYLQEWTYVESELVQLDRKGKLQKYSAPSMTVPPPLYRLTSSAINKFSPLLNVEHPIEGLDFLIELMQHLKLIQEGTPVKVWPKGKEAYLKMDEMTQHAMIVEGYFSLDSAYELWMMSRNDVRLTIKRWIASGGHYGTISMSTLTSQISLMRHIVLRVLANLPDGQWFDVMDVAKLLAHYWSNVNDYQFNKDVWTYRQKEKTPNPLWYVTDGIKPITDSFQLQMLFLKGMLTRPLSWLGLADVAVRDDKMLFRLHGLGDLYLNRVGALGKTDREVVTSDVGETAAPNISVKGTMITVNPSTISPAAHSYLSSIAKLENAVPGKFEYILDSVTVHKTFEAGENEDALVKRWKKLFGKQMPKSVRVPFSEWWKSYGNVRLYRDVTIIEFGDEYAIEEMKLNTDLADVMVGQLSPTLVIIPKTAVPTLKQQLEKAGYTPKVTEEASR